MTKKATLNAYEEAIKARKDLGSSVRQTETAKDLTMSANISGLNNASKDKVHLYMVETQLRKTLEEMCASAAYDCNIKCKGTVDELTCVELKNKSKEFNTQAKDFLAQALKAAQSATLSASAPAK